MGDVVGDLNRRRGLILGMEESAAGKVIDAQVPLGEMFGYATDLRSATQGRATFTMEFEKYAEAPKNITEAVMAITASVIFFGASAYFSNSIVKVARP